MYTGLSSKPTDTFNYLHWWSCHPLHTKRSIPHSLPFRLVEFVPKTLHSHVDSTNRQTTLSHMFYPTNTVKLSETPRSKAVHRKDRSQTGTQRIPLVFTCNPALPTIPSVLKNIPLVLFFKPQIGVKTTNTRHLPETAFRGPKNLFDLLGHSEASRRDTQAAYPGNHLMRDM